jgi:hypothetical protein
MGVRQCFSLSLASCSTWTISNQLPEQFFKSRALSLEAIPSFDLFPPFFTHFRAGLCISKQEGKAFLPMPIFRG